MLLVYLIMVAQFQSLKSPFIVMFTIPLRSRRPVRALAHRVRRVGYIGDRLRDAGGHHRQQNGLCCGLYQPAARRGADTREAILEAGATRIRPILMTSLTTVLALSPWRWGLAWAAADVSPSPSCARRPDLATLLTLFIVPVMYEALNRKKLVVIRDEDLADVKE